MRLRQFFLMLFFVGACAPAPQVSTVAPEAASAAVEPSRAPTPPPTPPKLPPAPETKEEDPESHDLIEPEALTFEFGLDPSSRTVHLQAEVSEYSLQVLAVDDLKELATDVERCLRLDEQIEGVTVVFDLEDESQESELREISYELEGFVEDEGWCVHDLFFTEAYVEYE